MTPEPARATPRAGVFAALRRVAFGRSLAAHMADRRDNIVLLRLIAAALVLFGHSYALFGVAGVARDPVHALGDSIYAHFVGVMAFFVVSGLLIVTSWQRRPELARFVRARILRIFPALIVCVFACAFVLGPLLSTLPPSRYFIDAETLRYVVGNATLLDVRMTLPGVFADRVVTNAVNGSLWTLPIEAELYIGVAVLGMIGLLARPRLAIAVIGAIVIALVAWPHVGGAPLPFGTTLMGFFAAGALAALAPARVPLSSGLMLALLAACALARSSPFAQLALWSTVGYGTLWLAYVPRLDRLRPPGDWSYGVYLWGFPVQQALLGLGLASPLALFACAAPIALLLAALSWALVEKSALRWKTPTHAPASGVAPDGAS